MAYFENVRKQALLLSSADRSRLAAELLGSVENNNNTVRFEGACEAGIRRRIRRIDAGKASGRSWDDIKQEFHSRYER